MAVSREIINIRISTFCEKCRTKSYFAGRSESCWRDWDLCSQRLRNQTGITDWNQCHHSIGSIKENSWHHGQTENVAEDFLNHSENWEIILTNLRNCQIAFFRSYLHWPMHSRAFDLEIAIKSILHFLVHIKADMSWSNGGAIDFRSLIGWADHINRCWEWQIVEGMSRYRKKNVTIAGLTRGADMRGAFERLSYEECHVNISIRLGFSLCPR
jgi:hypothetical protein